MDLAYFKRWRMEINLVGRPCLAGPVPEPYEFVPWDESLLDAFAQAKYLSFRNEMDSKVFPCLAEFEGCRRLMREIVRKPGFLPEATWLIVHRARSGGKTEYCGAIQGVRDQYGLGAIQNVGVVPEHRNNGLGRCLLLHSLAGFRRRGAKRVYLEVTAQNDTAIRLYQRVGFVAIRTVYKAVETEYTT